MFCKNYLSLWIMPKLASYPNIKNVLKVIHVMIFFTDSRQPRGKFPLGKIVILVGLHEIVPPFKEHEFHHKRGMYETFQRQRVVDIPARAGFVPVDLFDMFKIKVYHVT